MSLFGRFMDSMRLSDDDDDDYFLDDDYEDEAGADIMESSTDQNF